MIWLYIGITLRQFKCMKGALQRLVFGRTHAASPEEDEWLPAPLAEMRKKCKNSFEIAAFVAANKQRWQESHQLQISIEPWHKHFQRHDRAFRMGPAETAKIYQSLAKGAMGCTDYQSTVANSPNYIVIYRLPSRFQLPRC